MRLFFVLAVSIAVHILILLLPLPEKQMKKQEIIPVSIIDIKKEEVQKKDTPAPKKVVEKPKKIEEKKETVKKQQPAKNELVNKDNSKPNNKPKVEKVENKQDIKKQVANNTPTPKNNKEEKPFRPKGADDPLVLPEINVPLTENMDIPEIKIPDIPKPNITNEMVENQQNIDITKELSSLQSASNSASSNNQLSSQVKEETKMAGNVENKTNLYNFDIAPSGNRKVVYVPKDPVFALANDTYVTVKFHIDKKGNTYNITFVTRSSVDVEKLAYDYVSNMKFDAIIDDRDDFAQITMFFKVQK